MEVHPKLRRAVAAIGAFAALFAHPTAVRAEYELGRGLSLFDGRLVIGGYFSLEAEFLDQTPDRLLVDDTNDAQETRRGFGVRAELTTGGGPRVGASFLRFRDRNDHRTETAVARAEGPAPAPTTPAPAAWTLIVHPANPLRSLDRAELERIYRRRQRFWPDGSAILALNLPSNDPLRRAFTAGVLHDDEAGLSTYWNREYFQGIAPPAVLKSSKAVRAYVAATPNAIGYVTREDVDSSVAAVEVDLAR